MQYETTRELTQHAEKDSRMHRSEAARELKHRSVNVKRRKSVYTYVT